MFSSIVHLSRLARAGWALTREGAFALVDPTDLPAGPAMAIRLGRLLGAVVGRRNPQDARLAAAFSRLGPSWIKLGQFLATRRDLVGDAIASDLSQLQDRLPPFSDAVARNAIKAALGRPVEDAFDEFGPPVAAASIAQVHKAQADEGSLAVKVLRPGIERRFRRDLDTFFFAAHTIERIDPEARRLRPVDTVEILDRSVTIEMDLRMEAAAISEIAENTAEDPGFRVPKVDWSRSAKRVMTLEWIDGIPIADRDALEEAGHDLKRLGALVMQSFLRHALRDGFFHADMHPGNLFIDDEGNLVAVDFGIMGRLGPKERRFLAEILWGFIRRDYHRTAEVHFEAGYVPDIHSVDDFAQALRAIGEPLRDRTASEISMARLLTQLFEVTELFDMKTRPELLLLQKTMVVVEGVARHLDPELDMWTTSEPIVGEWIRKNLGPEGALHSAAEGAGNLGRLLLAAPELLVRGERIAAGLATMARDGFHLDRESVEAIAAAEARRTRSGRVALWISALSLATIAAALWW
ncbi:2-polyprenylphenol 6-hydroxylase [Microbaculum marinisediminis]|uniref:2-polyprenylphenol 6-hydroxylase n=1 Tax=Microbaculum marinisediminis TaxID=2931392 RepID=A0AAW5QVY5_9HYPH|nr:2-polyprenylphenol 6-hydroxylase [Microbaculum sp. A6E488]MCT8972105.1 2-polyprenylphenol 6-hydroxylase [Microbaculum sp. A6E488]